MKLILATVAYLVIGTILGLGILQAVRGHPGLLIGAAIAYLVGFGAIGCLPKKSH